MWLMLAVALHDEIGTVSVLHVAPLCFELGDLWCWNLHSMPCVVFAVGTAVVVLRLHCSWRLMRGAPWSATPPQLHTL